MSADSIDYNTHNTTSLVSIGTHSLYVSTHGPPRTSPSQPILILISGTAGTSAKWPPLMRAVSPLMRILCYDRSGIGRSEPSPSPDPPTLDSISSDLHALLTATKLKAPYILLGHSWGGMIATYFASTFAVPISNSIKGLILLDAGAPTHSLSNSPSNPEHKDFTTDPGSPWSHPCVAKITQNLNFLALSLPPESTDLTDDEYVYLATSTSTPQHIHAATREFQALQNSYLPFLRRQFLSTPTNPNSNSDISTPLPLPLLTGVPIITLHAHAYQTFQTLYDAGTTPQPDGPGNGTETERVAFRELLLTWKARVRANQEQFLRATEDENRMMIECKLGTGHDVMLQDVESCVEGVRWVLGKVR